MDKDIILKKELKGFNINIDDIEPNDNILGALEQQVKKQKEVIDKIKNVQIEMPKSNYSYDYMIYRSKIDEILKEVSE